MAVFRDHPYPAANFLVNLGGVDPHALQAGVIEVTLPEARIQVSEYREGTPLTACIH